MQSGPRAKTLNKCICTVFALILRAPQILVLNRIYLIFPRETCELRWVVSNTVNDYRCIMECIVYGICIPVTLGVNFIIFFGRSAKYIRPYFSTHTP
jgi:hypothetical protein